MKLADLLEILISVDIEPDKYPRKKLRLIEIMGTAIVAGHQPRVEWAPIRP